MDERDKTMAKCDKEPLFSLSATAAPRFQSDAPPVVSGRANVEGG